MYPYPFLGFVSSFVTPILQQAKIINNFIIINNNNYSISMTLNVCVCWQIEVDWEKIEAKMEMEYQKERERPERPVASTPSSAAGGVSRGPSSSTGAARPGVRT